MLSALVVVNSNLFLTLVHTFPTTNRYRGEPTEELRVEDDTQYRQMFGKYAKLQKEGKGKLIRVAIVDAQGSKTVEKTFPQCITDERFSRFPLTISVTFGEQQEAAFRLFDRPRGKGSDDKEVRFSTLAHWWGWENPNWRSTHFEALVSCSRTAGLVCCQGTFPSFPRVGAMKDLCKLDSDATRVKRAANKARHIAQEAFKFMLRIGLLKNCVQIAVQVYRFCHKCQAVERGTLAEQPDQQDIGKLLFLFVLAAFSVSDIYVSTSKVYDAVYMPLREHARRQSSSAPWDFGTYEGFFLLDKAYAQMRMLFGIFVICIFLLLGRLIVEDLGPGYSMPLCVEHAAVRGSLTVRGTSIFLVVIAVLCCLLRYRALFHTGSKSVDQAGALKEHLDGIFNDSQPSPETEGGPLMALVWKLEDRAGDSEVVRRELDADGEYLLHLLGRYRPMKEKITANEFDAWVQNAKRCATKIEKDTQDAEKKVTQDAKVQSEEDKVFDMVDNDRSGHVDRDELKKVYQAIAKALKKKDPEKTAKDWTKKAFKKANDSFDKEAFVELLRRSAVLQNLLNPKIRELVHSELHAPQP